MIELHPDFSDVPHFLRGSILHHKVDCSKNQTAFPMGIILRPKHSKRSFVKQDWHSDECGLRDPGIHKTFFAEINVIPLS